MESRPAITIVEDDPTVRTVVGDYLRAHDFTVVLYGDGLSAQKALRARLPDVLVVDRMLPGISGDELCRDVRASSDIPIIMLTALGSVSSRIEGLEHGADDYLAKPFAMKELHLRIQAMLRRHQSAVPVVSFTVGRFRLDPVHRRAWAGDREIALTTREYELFLYVAQHPDRLLTRDEILRNVWGWSFGDASTVTVHVRRLREKIEPEPRFPLYLRTEWGAGYTFTPEGDGQC
ncbi:response regulator transcription factor [Paramicrobacterium fandaimingii]|uniref:response regulator transcription factor n=1 Tax=Paramicrobacterium fandaimingii TaxID=2708079 RepID=UPI00141F4B57|nr:response regulator transcription factor [Microbacterium fandaimingii]